jgi:hypothetical protein
MTDAYQRLRARERKREERARNKSAGWKLVSVRVPPGTEEEIKQIVAQKRADYLRTEEDAVV